MYVVVGDDRTQKFVIHERGLIRDCRSCRYRFGRAIIHRKKNILFDISALCEYKFLIIRQRSTFKFIYSVRFAFENKEEIKIKLPEYV